MWIRLLIRVAIAFVFAVLGELVKRNLSI